MAGERISTKREFYLVQLAIEEFPKYFRTEILSYLYGFSGTLLARARAGVPQRKGQRPTKFAASRPGLRPSGGLTSLLSSRVNEKDMRLSVGLLTRDAAERGFYGFVLDAGRGLKRQQSKPRTRMIAGAKVNGRFGLTSGYTKPYSRAISTILPGRYDITFGRTRAWAREQIGPFLGRAYDRALVHIGWAKS